MTLTSAFLSLTVPFTSILDRASVLSLLGSKTVNTRLSSQASVASCVTTTLSYLGSQSVSFGKAVALIVVLSLVPVPIGTVAVKVVPLIVAM